MAIMGLVLARTTEQGSRQLVWAAVGGAGRDFELRGAYVNKADIAEVSDYALSDDAAVAQRRIWVRPHCFMLISEPFLRV
jgi:retinol dehydrogenase 12